MNTVQYHGPCPCGYPAAVGASNGQAVGVCGEIRTMTVTSVILECD